MVEWHMKEALEEEGAYDAEKDFQFYKTPASAGLPGF